MHKQPAYENLSGIVSQCNVAEVVASRVFSLPMHPNLSFETQQQIIKALTEVIE
jgi:dTDP-4-amino-4,6-dideoxygalactose transaminase